MKIVHEINQLDRGGAERVIRNIIKFDDENEYTIIAYKDGDYKQDLEEAGAKVVILGEKDNLDLEADLIHIHSGGGISSMALNLGKELPVLETIHSPLRSPMRDEFIVKRVGVSDAVTRMNSNCVTIRNGIDLDELKITREHDEVMEELGIPKGKKVIGRLGRLGKDKGLETFLLVCKKLQDKGHDFVPLIVGGEARDLDGYIGKLKLMADCLPLENVIFTGEKTDIANYLQIMDVFLYPSPTEGFGLAFIEAMYMQNIVVSYNNDVNREIIGGHSILTENSIDALAKGVENALDQNVIDALLGSQMRFVETEYSAERMSIDYQNLYKELVNV